jgi:Fur family transcriptional regulator, ferric uptake regulator
MVGEHQGVETDMTGPVQTPALRFGEIDEVYSLLRAKGHRISTPCRLVLEALFAAEGPISAQEIARNSPMSASDPSSVYRNLERLERLGVARHVHLGHGPSLYMLVGGGEKEYLVCERCDRAVAVDPARLDAVRRQIHKRFGYEARFAHFPIVGLCAKCAGEEASDKLT